MPNKPTPPPKRRRLTGKRIGLIAGILLLVVAYCVLTISRPFSELTPAVSSSKLHLTTPSTYIPWPNYGQSALGLSSGQVIASHGDSTPVPMASAAKIITALCVLDKKPLAGGAQGPTITLSDADQSLYDKYVAEDGSVVAVRSGQTITERQALEAMLLPSANNIADTLAIWAFGSIGAYTNYANSYLQTKGLNGTHIGSDASGFLPDSTSTAIDMVKLGGLAMQNTALAQIVGERTATIPGIGTVYNVDTLLGSNGIVGIKTGNNDQDGGVFVGAATVTIGGKTVTVISAIAGGSNLNQVLDDSANILAVARTSFTQTAVVSKGEILGTYVQADGSSLQAVASQDLNVTMLHGDTVNAQVHLQSISYNTKAGQTVGHINVPATTFDGPQNIPLVLKQNPIKPTVWYRLTHP